MRRGITISRAGHVLAMISGNADISLHASILGILGAATDAVHVAI